MKTNNDGFTLIELMIVIGIIGVLATIAIPLLLGQREKAKITVFKTNANNISTEVVGMMDDYDNGLPIIIQSDENTLACYEMQGADTKNKCSALYPDLSDIQTYANVGDVLDPYVDYRNIILKETSPFNASPLIDRLEVSAGRISILNSADNVVTITATGMGDGELFSKSISLR